MSSKRLWRHVALSVLAAGPAGGFLFGVLNAGDPDGNPIGRVFYSFMMAALTPLHGGFPPNDAAGPGQTFNVWPHIAAACLLIFGLLVYRDRKSAKKRSEPKG